MTGCGWRKFPNGRLSAIRLLVLGTVVQRGAPTKGLGAEAIPEQIAHFVDLRLPLAFVVVEERPLNLARSVQVADAHAQQTDRLSLDRHSRRQQFAVSITRGPTEYYHVASPHCVTVAHTHGGGELQVLDNLHVLTGEAEYGRPEIRRVLEVE